MIPVEAVEAAIRTMPEYTPDEEADSFERETNDQCRAKVERILEAAAPYMHCTCEAKEPAPTKEYNFHPEAVEAAEEAVRRAMIEYGPDGHTDGSEEITRAALEAALAHLRGAL